MDNTFMFSAYNAVCCYKSDYEFFCRHSEQPHTFSLFLLIAVSDAMLST